MQRGSAVLKAILRPRSLLYRACRLQVRAMQARADGEDEWASMLKTAEQREDPAAMYLVGMAYLREPKGAPSGKAWLREAAEMGHSRAQAELGRIVYDEMEALRAKAHVQDYQAAAEAERWLRRASDQGEADASRTLIPLCVTRGDLFGACQMALLWLRRRLSFQSSTSGITSGGAGGHAAHGHGIRSTSRARQ